MHFLFSYLIINSDIVQNCISETEIKLSEKEISLFIYLYIRNKNCGGRERETFKGELKLIM